MKTRLRAMLDSLRKKLINKAAPLVRFKKPLLSILRLSVTAHIPVPGLLFTPGFFSHIAVDSCACPRSEKSAFQFIYAIAGDNYNGRNEYSIGFLSYRQ